MGIHEDTPFPVKLTPGMRYNIDLLKFVGWAIGGNIRLDAVGQSPKSYFESDGTFIGEDSYSVQPVYQLDSIQIVQDKPAESHSVAEDDLWK